MLGWDASTTGGGAWLAPNYDMTPTRYMATAWSEEDEKLLRARRGDPGSQAVWETYALLLAIEAWAPLLSRRFGTLELRGDAQGVLQAILKRRAKSPIINLLVAEIQLCLAASMFDIFGAHVWSEDNGWADDLSRLEEGATLPSIFENTLRTNVYRKGANVKWKFLTPEGVHAAVTARAGEEGVARTTSLPASA